MRWLRRLRVCRRGGQAARARGASGKPAASQRQWLRGQLPWSAVPLPGPPAVQSVTPARFVAIGERRAAEQAGRQQVRVARAAHKAMNCACFMLTWSAQTR